MRSRTSFFSTYISFLALLLLGFGDNTARYGTSGEGGSMASAMCGNPGSMSSEQDQAHAVLVVDGHGTPQANIPLVANDVTGTVVGVCHTGIDGKADVVVPPGGSVSSFEAAGTSFSIHAIVDPPASAPVRFPYLRSDESPQDTPPEKNDTTTYQVTFSHVPPTATAVLVRLDTCDGRMTLLPKVTAEMTNQLCPGESTHRIFAFAMDDQQTPLSWGNLTTGVSPGGVIPVTLSLTEASTSATTVHVTGIPSGTTKLWTSLRLVGVWLGKSVDMLASKGLGLLQVPRVPDLKSQVSVHAEMVEGGFFSAVGHGESFSPGKLPASWSFDVGDAGWVVLKPVDVSVPEHPSLTWSTPSPNGADWIHVGLGWNVGFSSVRVDVVLPPTHPTSWRLPEIPEELASFRPRASSITTGASVEYWEWESVESYEQVLSGLPVDSGNTATTRRAGRDQ